MASIGKSLMASLLVLLAACARGPEISSDQVRQVELGMSEQDVVAILGKSLESGPSANFEGRRTWTYTHWRLAPSYPMLWVHFEGGLVVEVFAKSYTDWGTEDEGVYALSSELHFESTEAFETLFRQPRSSA